jgi:hypothetical protein
MKACLECGTQFDPGTTRRQYCSLEHSQKARDRRRQPKRSKKTVTGTVIAYLGSGDCTNCRYSGAGRRWAFWWDKFDREDLILETAMLLCSKCWPKFNRVKANQDSSVSTWERWGWMHTNYKVARAIRGFYPYYIGRPKRR